MPVDNFPDPASTIRVLGARFYPNYQGFRRENYETIRVLGAKITKLSGF